MSGLAGLGMASLYQANEGRVKILDFHPPAPGNFDISTLSETETRDGANASGVPGNLAGWCFLVRELGSKSLPEIFAPAIGYARDGYPISGFYQAMAKVGLDREMQPEWHALYIEGSDGAEVNNVFRQPALADTLQAIASEGPGYLYGGPLGRAMIGHLQSLGGCMTMADLEAVAPFWEEPISARYHDLEVYVPPPPAESFQFLLSLRILDGLVLGALAGGWGG